MVWLYPFFTHSLDVEEDLRRDEGDHGDGLPGRVDVELVDVRVEAELWVQLDRLERVVRLALAAGQQPLPLLGGRDRAVGPAPEEVGQGILRREGMGGQEQEGEVNKTGHSIICITY